ncbi:MAG: carbohydrate ABC transporter permease [Anaerolineae bacterium]|nr:carbohydrate ABC transporter permease [Anaerolineae bacterium]
MHDRRKIIRNVLFLAIVLQAFVLMIPLFYMLSTSFKLPSEVFDLPIRWIPEQLHFENYIQPLQEKPFLRWMFNSAFVATIVTILNVLTSALAGYSFAKFTYPGRDLLFGFILATFMIPLEAMIVPLFVLVKDLGWLNSYIGLIIPAGGSAFGIFMMRQHMIAMPDELMEAARIDGASEFRIFWNVVLPISQSALVSLAIFAFMWNWNSFLYPLLVASQDAYRTLPLGLASFESAYSTNYPQLMAVSFLSMLPVLILFFVLQNRFIESMALSGIKG